jgi:hypothetical protein
MIRVALRLNHALEHPALPAVTRSDTTATCTPASFNTLLNEVRETLGIAGRLSSNRILLVLRQENHTGKEQSSFDHKILISTIMQPYGRLSRSMMLSKYLLVETRHDCLRLSSLGPRVNPMKSQPLFLNTVRTLVQKRIGKQSQLILAMVSKSRPWQNR